MIGGNVSKSIRFRIWKRSSVDRWKQTENTSANKNIWLRFRSETKTDTIENGIRVVGATTLENADGNGGFQKRFRKCSVLNTEAFENGDKKASYTAVSISVFERFIADDRRKRAKKYAFSNYNVSVWTGEKKKTKTLVWAKVFWAKRIL